MPMLAIMNTIAAYAQSPREMVAISSVATMPTDIDAARSLFFHPRTSAIAPSTGPITAVIVTAIVVAHAKRAVASVGERPAAAKSLKKRGKTAVITVVWNAEFAQSYMAQARSSGRFKPTRDKKPRPIAANHAQNVLRAIHSRSSESTTTYWLPSLRTRSCLTRAASDVWMLDGPPRR